MGAFDGVPITFKDDSRIKDFRSSMGSFFLNIGAFELPGFEREPPSESEQSVKMFEDQGAIALCVTTCPEMFRELYISDIWQYRQRHRHI